MSKYDNQMEFFGGRDTGEWCFTLGTLKLDDRLVIVDRKHLEALEECAKALEDLAALSVPEDSGAYDDEDGPPPDDAQDDYFITYGQIRRARIALTKLEKSQ